MPKRQKGNNIATQRPAEVSTLTIGAIVTIIAYALDITDEKVLAALPIVIGVIPSLFTGFFAIVRGEG